MGGRGRAFRLRVGVCREFAGVSEKVLRLYGRRFVTKVNHRLCCIPSTIGLGSFDWVGTEDVEVQLSTRITPRRGCTLSLVGKQFGN